MIYIVAGLSRPLGVLECMASFSFFNIIDIINVKSPAVPSGQSGGRFPIRNIRSFDVDSIILCYCSYWYGIVLWWCFEHQEICFARLFNVCFSLCAGHFPSCEDDSYIQDYEDYCSFDQMYMFWKCRTSSNKSSIVWSITRPPVLKFKLI